MSNWVTVKCFAFNPRVRYFSSHNVVGSRSRDGGVDSEAPKKGCDAQATSRQPCKTGPEIPVPSQSLPPNCPSVGRNPASGTRQKNRQTLVGESFLESRDLWEAPEMP